MRYFSYANYPFFWVTLLAKLINILRVLDLWVIMQTDNTRIFSAHLSFLWPHHIKICREKSFVLKLLPWYFFGASFSFPGIWRDVRHYSHCCSLSLASAATLNIYWRPSLVPYSLVPSRYRALWVHTKRRRVPGTRVKKRSGRLHQSYKKRPKFLH